MLMPVVVWLATSTHPTRYIGAHDCDCQTPSIAASLTCWLCVTEIAMLAPNTTACRTARTPNIHTATVRFLRASSTCRPLSRYHALTLMTRAAPTIHDATH